MDKQIRELNKKIAALAQFICLSLLIYLILAFWTVATDGFSAITNFIVFYSSYKFKNKKRQIASFKVRFHLPSFPRCNFYQDEGCILHKYMK